MKTYWGGGGGSTRWRFLVLRIELDTHCVGGYVVPRAGVDALMGNVAVQTRTSRQTFQSCVLLPSPGRSLGDAGSTHL
jgi:hypothetical protein